MRKAIIFNGPPSSGKDFGAFHVKKKYHAQHLQMKDKLISITCEIYSISRKQWDAMYTRKEKERPQKLLEGKTPRQAIIHVAEKIIKPNFGLNYFGKATAKRLRNGLNVVSDGGFTEEAIEFYKKIGADNLFVIRVFSPNCTWGDDSRSYFDVETMNDLGIQYVDIDNDRSPRYLHAIDKHVMALNLSSHDTLIPKR